VVEHLLQEQELAVVIMRHQHLVVAERLAERMRRHLHIKTEVGSDALKDTVNRLDAEWFVNTTAVIGYATEHIVAQAHTIRVLQVERHSFPNSLVDSDVTVLLALAGVTCLLLEHREAILERKVVVDEIGEPKHTKVANTESKVDADNKEHIVAVSPFLNQIV